MRRFPSVTVLRTQSDERLVALARGGSESAFEAIVERYGRQLQRACRRVLSPSRAEDAVQQAFLAAWVALQRGDDVTNLRAWLLKIARNSSLNVLRAPGYDFSELHEALDTGAAPQEELERREVMRQTLAGLAALPERQREALLHSAVGGVAYEDIAREFGLSQGATRQLVMRARTSLRAAMTAVVPWPVVQWIALSGRSDGALRIAQVAAAGGGAGATTLISKAAVVATVAVSVMAGPSILDKQHDAIVHADTTTAVARTRTRTASAVERRDSRRAGASTSADASGSAATRGRGSESVGTGTRAPSGGAAPGGAVGDAHPTAVTHENPTVPVAPGRSPSGPGPESTTVPAAAPAPQTTGGPAADGGPASPGDPATTGGAGTEGSGAPDTGGGAPGDDDTPQGGEHEGDPTDDGEHDDDHEDDAPEADGHGDEHDGDHEDDHEDDDEHDAHQAHHEHDRAASEHDRGSVGPPAGGRLT